jgi:hypothetical protein
MVEAVSASSLARGRRGFEAYAADDHSLGTPDNDPFREAFVRGMRDLGYVEGRKTSNR